MASTPRTAVRTAARTAAPSATQRTGAGAVDRALTNRSLTHAIRHLTRRDPDLAAIVKAHGTPPLGARRPGFDTIVRIILEQQVSLAAATTMFKRLHTRAGGVTPQSVATLGIAGMRSIGFTGQKASCCHGLATDILSGALDLSAIARSTDEAGMSRLLAVRGLGRWSVEVYYLMALRRPDVWPHGDLALAVAVHEVKRLRARPSHPRLTAIAEQWAPYRSVAARILWQHYLGTR